MRKLVHVPVQPWERWIPNDLFGGWLSALGSFKTLTGAIGLILEACLILPCLVPLVLQSFRTTVEVTIKKQTKTSHTCNNAIKIQTSKSR
jgi:hypothetical protein